MINRKITDIKTLAQERPLRTVELYGLNDLLGYAYMLKRFANIKEDYQIKGILEHHSSLFMEIESNVLSFPLPAIFTFSVYRFLHLRELTNKALFALGPPIHYAPNLFSEEEISNLKKSLGKTLLVFLPYSEIPYMVNFDHSKVITEIKKIEKNYHNILVCLGWMEILRNFEEPYISQGYTCVTPGHVFDFTFLPRLKSLILLADHTISFSINDYLGYSIYLNKPHWIIPIQIDINTNKSKSKYFHGRDCFFKGEKVINFFKEPYEDISEKQKEIVNVGWGISDIKTPNELKELFQITEDMFNKGYLPNNKRDPIVLCQIIDYLEKNQNEKAKKLINLSKHLFFHRAWQDYLKATIAIKENNIQEAKKLILRLAKNGAFFKKLGENLNYQLENNKFDENIIRLTDLFETYPRPLYYMKKKYLVTY